MRVRRTSSPARAALAATAVIAVAWCFAIEAPAAAPPSLPPLPFQPYGFQQQLLPGQPDASFIQPRPLTTMNSMFTLAAEPFGELGHNLTGSPTQSVPHRQPIPTGPTLSGGGGRSAGGEGGGPVFMPQPGYSKVPLHRRPLGW